MSTALFLEMTSILYFCTTTITTFSNSSTFHSNHLPIFIDIHPPIHSTVHPPIIHNSYYVNSHMKKSIPSRPIEFDFKNETMSILSNFSTGEREISFVSVLSPESFSSLRYLLRGQRSISRQVNFKLHEELENGTIIGNLLHETQLVYTYSEDVIKQITFRFVAESVAFFHLDHRTGMISVNSRIDRDSPTLCRQNPSCELHFSVVTQPLQYMTMVKVVVEILDINDNQPAFKEPVFHLKINEAVAISSFYNLPEAQDWDSPTNGIQRYAMNPEIRQFALKVDSKFDPKGDEISLIVMEKLDRESQAEFRFQMLAFDTGQEPGILEVIISVLDSNDNKPEFTRPYYEAIIPEDLEPGTTFIRVNAVDPDLGLSGQVEYSFSPHSQIQHSHLFGINNSTGEVFLRNPLDRELTFIYQLVVVGHDRGPDSIGTETSLTVHIEDINDNEPKIVINTLDGLDTTSATVVENAPLGTFVAHVRASDPDAKANGEVSCLLVARDGYNNIYTTTVTPFILIQKSFKGEYQVVTTSVLDREKQSSYTVVLQCKDGGLKPKTTETFIQIVVGDLNDNAPVFSMQMYKAFLTENNDIGASILRVSASDLDIGDNGRVFYTIPGNIAVTFHVDQTGIVSALDTVDREKYDTFKFPILAIDRGDPPKTGSALVVVIVEDMDDEKPIFLQSNYTFNIHENMPQGSSVGVVLAVDKDGPTFNSISYFIGNDISTKGDRSIDLFYIDALTGLISTRDVLDREKLGRHRFIVTAKDHKTGLMSSTAAVIVFVLDRQDNPPIIVYPHHGNETVHIPTELPVGSHITRVIAHDLDATSEFNRLVHSIVIIEMHNSFEDIKQLQNMNSFFNIFHSNVTPDVTDDDSLLQSELKTNREIPGLFNMDPDMGIITLTSVLDEYLDKIFQCLVIVRNPISRFDPTPSAVAANLYIVINSTIALPDGFSDGSTLERSIFSFQGGAGMFRNLSDLLLYLIVAVVGGCVFVVLFVIFAITLLRRRERSRRLERVHKLNDGTMVGSIADVCKAGSKKIQTEESQLWGETSRDHALLKTSEQIPFCELKRKELLHEDVIRPPWTVTLEKRTSSPQCSHLHQVSKSGRCNQIWRTRNIEDDNFLDNVEGNSERPLTEQAKRLIPPPPPPSRGSFWKNHEHQHSSQSIQTIPNTSSYSKTPNSTKTVSFSLLPSYLTTRVDYFTSTTSNHKFPSLYAPLSSQTLKNLQKIRPSNQAHNPATMRPQQHCFCGAQLTCDQPSSQHDINSYRSIAQFKKCNKNQQNISSSLNRPSTLRIDEFHNLIHNLDSRQRLHSSDRELTVVPEVSQQSSPLQTSNKSPIISYQRDLRGDTDPKDTFTSTNNSFDI